MASSAGRIHARLVMYEVYSKVHNTIGYNPAAIGYNSESDSSFDLFADKTELA